MWYAGYLRVESWQRASELNLRGVRPPRIVVDPDLSIAGLCDGCTD